MALTIPDQIVADSGLSERELLIEIACRLYNADKLTKPAASRLAGLSRVEFENALLERGLPWIRIRDEDAMQDILQARELRKTHQ